MKTPISNHQSPLSFPSLLLLQVLLVATTMNNCAPATQAAARFLSKPHVHAYTHMLPRRQRHVLKNPTTLSPSLDTGSNIVYKSRSLKLRVSLDFAPNSTTTSLPQEQSSNREMAETIDAQKLRLEFLDVLRSRRTPEGMVFSPSLK